MEPSDLVREQTRRGRAFEPAHLPGEPDLAEPLDQNPDLDEIAPPSSSTSAVRDLVLGAVAMAGALALLVFGVWVGERWRTFAEWTAILFVAAIFGLGAIGVQRARRGWNAWRPSGPRQDSDAADGPLAPLERRTRRLLWIAFWMLCVGPLSVALVTALTANDAGEAPPWLGAIGFFLVIFGLFPLMFGLSCLNGLRRGRRDLERGEPVTMTDDELTTLVDAQRELVGAEGASEAAFGVRLRPDIVEQRDVDLHDGVDLAAARVDAIFADLGLRQLWVDQPDDAVRRRGIAMRSGFFWIPAPVLVTVDLLPRAPGVVCARVRAVSKYQRRREHNYFTQVVEALTAD